jgi:hypothetical protein
MLHNAGNFDQPLAGWDLASVTNFGYMLKEATAFNKPLAGWDTVRCRQQSSPLPPWRAAACLLPAPPATPNTPRLLALQARAVSMVDTFNTAEDFNQPLPFDTARRAARACSHARAPRCLPAAHASSSSHTASPPFHRRVSRT